MLLHVCNVYRYVKTFTQLTIAIKSVFLVNLHVVSVFHPVLFLRESGTEAKVAFKGNFTPAREQEVSCCWVSEGSVAEESCDHSGASAPSLLMELRDLQGYVYQGGQHHLHKETTQRMGHFLYRPFCCNVCRSRKIMFNVIMSVRQ